jgi:predicted secreted protein
MPSKNVSISRSGAFRWTMKATRTGRWIVTASYAVGATTYTSNVVKVIVHK